MVTWLVDEPSIAYFVLSVAALVLGAGWWLTRGEPSRYSEEMGLLAALWHRRLERKHFFALGLVSVCGLALLIWLLGALLMTDSKRIRLIVEEMAAGVKAKNPDRIFGHVSEQFLIGTTNKESMRRRVEDYIRSGQIQEIDVFDFEPAEFSPDHRQATIIFVVKAKGDLLEKDWLPYNCRAIFVLDPDGQWRLKTFVLYQPQIDPKSKQSIPLPF